MKKAGFPQIRHCEHSEAIQCKSERQEPDRHGLWPRDDGLSWRCDRWKKAGFSQIRHCEHSEAIQCGSERQELDRRGLWPRDDGLSWRCDRRKNPFFHKPVIASTAKQSSAGRKGRSWIVTACGLAMTV
ncbi:hypothetical protein MPL1_09105 [Methylophaga lonarensis MPL]|uniref:Uncharacterized protein n=1 Tax=Methylophaga lonarensis MPL TaxID=1286106 RepID=M7NZL8_9GAMM|nr:hypothetical protein [Methylophaga lonarensis]EMR12677.1 hypothetical protein MPL1_09105 [Methylophaga lonarensis MPL]